MLIAAVYVDFDLGRNAEESVRCILGLPFAVV